MTAAPGDESALVRVSDADRDVVVVRLKERAADGTLTLEEFSQRVGSALSATTRRELDLVVADLPAVPAATADRAPQRGVRRRFVGVMSGAHARGRWRTGDHVTAVAVMGGATLDFRHAVIDSGRVVVTAVAVMGGIDVIVPEGVEVSLSGLPIMGGKSLNIADVPVLPGSPRIVVRAFPIMGGVHVRSRGEHSRRKKQREVGDGGTTAALPASLDGTVTIMFVDVCGFSQLTERLGDTATQQLLSAHHRLVRQVVGEYDGRVLKVTGDGSMVAFSGTGRALRSAVALHHALQRVDGSAASERLQVHIGVHAGEVVRDGDDVIGQTVNLASRLTDAAGAEEILVSSLARDLTAGSRDFDFGEAREVELKGLGVRTAYPLEWRSSGDGG